MITLSLSTKRKNPYYRQIYEAIRHDIETGRIVPHEKLPSKRKLANDLKVSQTTVETAYSQLKAEGYIYAKSKSGYYAERIIAVPSSEKSQPVFILREQEKQENYCYDFQTGGVNTGNFPFSVWAKLTRETLNEDKDELLAATHPKGLYGLRREICGILRQYRGIEVSPEQVIVGAGWEYLLTLITQLLGNENIYGIEDPGYGKVPLILRKTGNKIVYLPVDNEGMVMESLGGSAANVIHVTPSHHFPLGVVTSAGRRHELLQWAEKSEDRYIIEDDYDSEFRLYGRPTPSIYTLDYGENVIYIKTFARSLAPSLRMAYMVLPPKLLAKYEEELFFYSSTVPRIEQHVLARFIAGNHYERHLNRMRNIYRRNREVFLREIKNSPLSSRVEVLKDDGGTHLLLKMKGCSEEDLIAAAENAGIKIYGLSTYFKGDVPYQYRDIVIAGFPCFTEKDLVLAVGSLLAAWNE